MKVKSVNQQDFGSLENLKFSISDIDDIQDDELLINVYCCGISFADILAAEGKYQDTPPLPFTPGLEVSGVVESVGSAVKEFHIGDEVIALVKWGGFSEKVKAKENFVIKKSKGMSFDTAACMIINYGTSYYALVERAKIKQNDKVLILGASGGIGLSAIEISKAIGCHVTAMASSADKLSACKDCGAEFIRNQIHRELEIHSKATQRFACMECMRARKVRLKLIKHHKYNCLSSKTQNIREDQTENSQKRIEKSPEYMGEELQEAYESDKGVRKLLKEDFKKRAINKKDKEEYDDDGDVTFKCPLFCDTMLNPNTNIDHEIQCAKNMEACKNCRIEYANNSIHWDVRIHSNMSERWKCAECLENCKIKIKLTLQHRNQCLKSQMPNFEEPIMKEYLTLINMSTKELGQKLKADYDSYEFIRNIKDEYFVQRIRSETNNKRSAKPTIKVKENKKNNDKWLKILVILLILIKIYSPIGVIDIMAFSIYALIKMAPTRMEDGSLKIKDLKKI